MRDIENLIKNDRSLFIDLNGKHIMQRGRLCRFARWTIPLHIHKISLCWRNSSKLEDMWSGKAFDFPETSSGKDSSYMPS